MQIPASVSQHEIFGTSAGAKVCGSYTRSTADTRADPACIEEFRVDAVESVMQHGLASDSILVVQESDTLHAAGLTPAEEVFDQRAVHRHQARFTKVSFM